MLREPNWLFGANDRSIHNRHGPPANLSPVTPINNDRHTYCYVHRNCYRGALHYKLSEQLHRGCIKDFFAVLIGIAGVFLLIKGVFLTGIEMRDLPVARLASGISAPLALRLA